MNALEVEDVSIRFGGLRALSEVSFAVPKGMIVGLIGPNGAGKTTMFNVIAGNLRPDAGSVHILGAETTGEPPFRIARRGVGRTFQPGPATSPGCPPPAPRVPRRRWF